MKRVFFQDERKIKAKLERVNRRGNLTIDFKIEDEENAPWSCLICTHYKYNHSNYRDLKGKFVHICMLEAPALVDITDEMAIAWNRYCPDGFQKRAIL